MSKKPVIRRCPSCGKYYDDSPSLSRRDNRTHICPDCGIAEAMADLENASAGKPLSKSPIQVQKATKQTRPGLDDYASDLKQGSKDSLDRAAKAAKAKNLAKEFGFDSEVTVGALKRYLAELDDDLVVVGSVFKHKRGLIYKKSLHFGNLKVGRGCLYINNYLSTSDD